MAFEISNKRNIIVLGVLILGIVIALLYFRPTQPAASEQQPNISQEMPKVNPGIAQSLSSGKCPANQCRNWIFGSCSRKELYKERECFRYGAFPDCAEETYYESHVESVEACDQNDCPVGKTFYNYTCV